MYKIIKGKVIRGKSLGAKIGFPTANIYLKDSTIAHAVYKINIIIGETIYRGAGTYLKDKDIFEAHIFDFNNDIYGKEIEIIILYKIRDNFHFDSKEALKNQIKDDIQKVKKMNDYVLTFGTFDIFHPGHNYYLSEAKKYGDVLVTIVGTDKNVKKFKGHEPINNVNKRVENLKSLKISDIVCKGEETSTIKWLELYHPKVVCLGYDQHGFSEKLKDRIQERNLDIKIIRCEGYKQNIYKSSLIGKESDKNNIAKYK